MKPSLEEAPIIRVTFDPEAYSQAAQQALTRDLMGVAAAVMLTVIGACSGYAAGQLSNGLGVKDVAPVARSSTEAPAPPPWTAQGFRDDEGLESLCTVPGCNG